MQALTNTRGIKFKSFERRQPKVRDKVACMLTKSQWHENLVEVQKDNEKAVQLKLLRLLLVVIMMMTA